ncbi:hypothetical protein KIW84_UN0745 [Lathyrus oleraceus]|nr:hypothetical protein KIW84_UN0745 [Pisum sativum]
MIGSRHRRIKKQRRYDRLGCPSQVSLCNFSDTSSFKFQGLKDDRPRFHVGFPCPYHSELTVRCPGKRPERPVPNPFPRPHAATRSRRGSSSSSPPQPTGSELGPPCPALRANPFPSYGSILPTSLAYIVPSTRGCSPWRPDAVMSTTGHGRHSVLRIFKGRQGAPDTTRRAVLFQPLDPTSG